MDEPRVTYRRTRLTFLADLIEPLEPNDAFRIITAHGDFQMTKAEFYSDFRNVTQSKTYTRGITIARKQVREYAYFRVPRRAYKYALSGIAPPAIPPRASVKIRPTTTIERELLERASASDNDRAKLHSQILLASADGQTARSIAEATGCPYVTVRLVIRTFNSRGITFPIEQWQRQSLRTSGQ